MQDQNSKSKFQNLNSERPYAVRAVLVEDKHILIGNEKGASLLG
jgi:hypothetical protein